MDNRVADKYIKSAKEAYGQHKASYLAAQRSGDKAAMQKARDGMNSAHARAEQYRKGAGRGSGGVDGSLDKAYKPPSAPVKPKPFTSPPQGGLDRLTGNDKGKAFIDAMKLSKKK